MTFPIQKFCATCNMDHSGDCESIVWSSEKYCHFCFEPIGKLAGAQIQLKCYKHPVEVVHWFGGKHEGPFPFDVHFKIKIQGRLFKVVIQPQTPRTKVYIREKVVVTLSNTQATPPGQYYLDRDDIILNVQELLDITPDNAKKRLPTLLTFS